MIGPGALPFHAVENSSIPLVTGILVVAEDERINLARSAVTSFLRQTYPNFEIIIINASPMHGVLDNEWDTMKEFRVDPVQYPTIGALRNKAIEEARGEWILPFDDDDHSHLHRLFFQMAVRQSGCCVMLSEQARVDIERNMLCIHADPKGLPGTVLFPRKRKDDTLNLYDANMLEAGEDKEFVDRNFGSGNTTVLPTSSKWFPGPCASIAFYYWCIGNHERALKYFKDSIRLFEELGDIVHVAQQLTWASLMNWELDDLDTANHMIEKASKIFNSVENQNHKWEIQ